MKYLLEITRIVDGAVKGDRPKVAAYVQQLARKLRESGDERAASRLERTLGEVGSSEMALSAAFSQPRLPVDHDSRLALGDEIWCNPNDSPLVLEPTVHERVEEFLAFVAAADRLLASGVGIAPSMILYGPPGVGKTELARYISGRLGLPLITSRSDSLISSFLGNTAKNLRVLFEHASSRPCVLFLDELDALGKGRDDHHEMGELKRVVVSLLQNIDALQNETVLLGATNHHHLLDPAIWRRFAYRVEMSPPSHTSRATMMAQFLRGHDPDEDLDALAAIASGLTGADIRMVCESCIRSAIIRGDHAVCPTDLMRGLIRARLGEVFAFQAEAPERIRQVRDLATKVFTCKRLAAIFNTSEPTISRRLKDPGENNGRRRKCTAASDQDRHPARS